MEEQKNQVEELNRQIECLCNSKADEFRMLGYENVSGEDIWECVSANYTDQLPPMHRLVNDILSLRVNEYMNWMTMRVYKGEDL